MTNREEMPFAAAGLESRLEAIAKFLPVFRQDGFVFGVWNTPAPEGGITQFPWVELSDAARSFVRAAYDADWVIGFDWSKWAETAGTKKLRDDPAALSRARPEQLAKLLTQLGQCVFKNASRSGAYWAHGFS